MLSCFQEEAQRRPREINMTIYVLFTIYFYKFLLALIGQGGGLVVILFC